jgi:hypothetical protein
MPKGKKSLIYPLFLNVAYWGRQYQFGVKGYNPADKRVWDQVMVSEELAADLGLNKTG